MLTFFDYLRRRAYESIVSGVHEALENLDSGPLPDELQEPPPADSPLPAEPRKLVQSAAEENASAGNTEDGSETVPAPRRRGRPPKRRPS